MSLIAADAFDPEFRIDINDWIGRFDLRKCEFPGGSTTGPDGVALAELVRQEANLYSEGFTHAPCDLIVFGYGPGPRRDMTRVGGIPYRRSGTLWPRSSVTGKPLTFLCQVRVKESLDILGTLPGELVLVFVEHELRDWVWGDICAPVCEWQNLDIPPQDLVQAEEIPPPGFPVLECYGMACRYSDILTEHAIDQAIDVLMSKTRHKRDQQIMNPVTTSTYQYVRGWICQSMQWKIGGIPYLDDAAIEIYNFYKGATAGRFLMNISSLPAAALWRYAWLNCKNKKEFERFPPQESLDWYPDGSLHLFVMDDGSIRPKYSMMV